MKIYESIFKENVSKSELLSKMKEWFRLYNSKLYNNSLPMPSFQVKTLKNKVGLYTLDSKTILLSDFYDLTCLPKKSPSFRWGMSLAKKLYN